MGDVLVYYKAVALNGLVGCGTIFQTGVKPDIKDIVLVL